MTIWEATDRLQDALSLLDDVEKRRTDLLQNISRASNTLGMDPKALETLLDTTHAAAVGHVVDCMKKFTEIHGLK